MIFYALFIYLIWLIPFITIVPYGKTSINNVTIDIENWNLFYWLLAITALTTYVIFLKGLYFLRKVARILSDKHFSDMNIIHSKKAGIHFLLAGGLYFLIIVFLWLNRSITTGVIEIGTDMDLIAPLSLTIIGVFFIIQSKNLSLAKSFKEENELTV